MIREMKKRFILIDGGKLEYMDTILRSQISPKRIVLEI